MAARPEWLTARREGLGGSDMSALLRLPDGRPMNPWKSEWDVYAAKLGIGEAEEDSADKARGRYLERAVLEWAANDARATLRVPEPFTLERGPAPALGSPDGFLEDRSGWWGVEAKTSRSLDGWGPHLSDIVPIHYRIQCLWYLHVCKADRWDLAVFITLNDDFRRYVIERDDEVIRFLVDRATEWWRKHIVEGTPPDIDGSDAAGAWLLDRYPKVTTGLRSATEEEVQIASDFARLKAQGRELEDQERTLRNRLTEKIGDAEGLYWPGGKVTWKDQVARRVDTKALEGAHPELVETFRREARIRVLRTTIKPTNQLSIPTTEIHP